MVGLSKLLLLTQEELHNIVRREIVKVYSKIEEGSNYIVGKSEGVKPMLCVHLDTINTLSGTEARLNIDHLAMVDEYTIGLSSLGTKELACLGGDDRAGVYIALKVLMDPELREKYHIGFFKDEERGCIGSSNYLTEYRDYEEDVSAFIGLDRRGHSEVATYGVDNEELISIFTSLGYTQSMGSVTDASELANKVACVNLSVGYLREHTIQETQCIRTPDITLQTLRVIADKLATKVYNVEGGYLYDEGGYEDYEVYDKLEAYEQFIELMGYDPSKIYNKYVEENYNGSYLYR